MTTDIATTGGSLAIRPDQTAWTPDQQAVLQQSGIDNDVTSAELAAFLHLCQRTQLDPFSRQIYLIGRWDKKQQRKVFTPQTAIDGYRVIAQRVTQQTGGSYGYEDTLWCGKDGQWRDAWLADGPPAAAKVTVIRNGQRFSAVARFSEYVQTWPDGNPKALWATMPSGQTAKCAEALALRKAFPHDLAGVYTAEEMAQADNPERHLKSVQADEPNPWATPEPTRNFLTEAETAQDIEAVRKIWREAKQAGMPAPVLNGIVEISKLKAARDTAEPEVVEGVVVEVSDADLYAALGSGHPDVEAAAAEALYERSEQTVELPADDHAAAVAAFRAFTAEHGISDADADQQAYTALGAPLADVSPAAIWDLLSQLTNAA